MSMQRYEAAMATEGRREEYCVVEANRVRERGYLYARAQQEHRLQHQLNELATKGWALVSVDNGLLFLRRSAR